MIIFDTRVKELISVKDENEIYFAVGVALKKVPKSRIPDHIFFAQEERRTRKRRIYYITYYAKKHYYVEPDSVIPVIFPEEKAPGEGTKFDIGEGKPLFLTYKPPKENLLITSHIKGIKIGFLVRKEEK